MTTEKQTEQADKNMFWAEVPDFLEVMDRQVSQDTANYNPVGGDDERACANCQWYVPQTNACVIVQGFPQPIVSNGISDLWRAVVLPSDEMDPIAVRIVEGSSHLDDESETSDKATKTEGGVEFNPSDFAVVPDADAPSEWKLRLAEDRPGNFTAAQVGRAITAMQPGGFRGNRVELTTAQKSQAVSKISRAIGRVDGDDEAKDNLRERLDAVKEITITDKVLKRARNALKAAVSAVRPSEKSKAEIISFQKDANGQTRWVATFSNHFRDRDKPPEVFTEAAHKEFVSYIDQGGDMPELWHWHTPGTKFGTADWIDYDNGFITASGTIDEGHEDEAALLAQMKGLGLSHGYEYIPGQDGAIDWYRTFEISVLPNEKAANPWQDFAIIQSEVKEMFKADKREYLVSVLGEGKVAALEENNEARAKFLNEIGVDSKDFETEAPATTEGVTEQPTESPGVDQLIEQVTKGIVESEAFTGAMGRIATVEKTVGEIQDSVKGLQQTDEDKIRSAFAPAFDPTKSRGHIASQDSANEVETKEADELTEDMNWMNDIIDAAATHRVT